MERIREIFRTVPLFSELDDNEIDSIMALASTSTIPKKSIVVQEGDPGTSLYVILNGSVKISYYAPDGREVVLSILQHGSIFGEMSLLDKQPRSATVSTLEDSKLAQIRHGDFERLLLSQPSIALKLLSEVVSRLRRTSSILERISTMDVPHRLYNYIMDYCSNFGREDHDGYYSVKLPTHQLMADQLSTSRETISRAISAMKKEEILLPAKGRGEVRVDCDALDTLLFAMQ